MGLFGPPNIENMKAKRDVNGLIKALRYRIDSKADEHALIRMNAARALGEIGDSRAVEPLIGALRDKDPHVQKAAAEALDSIGWKPCRDENAAYYWTVRKQWKECMALGTLAVEPLIAAIEIIDYDLQRHAIEVLGQIGDARAVEPLGMSLRSSFDMDVRRAAAEALGKLGDARAVGPLTAALDIPGSLESRAAIQALDKLGWQPDQSKAGVIYWFAKSRWDKCIEIGTPAIGPLIHILDYDSAAADVLAKIGAPAIEPLIAKLNVFKSYKPPVVEALVKIGPPAVIPLVAGLKHGDSNSQDAAIEALARIRDARAVEHLITLLKDENRYVREAAVRALGKIPDARAVTHLVSFVADMQNFYARELAVRALGEIGLPALKSLIAIAKDYHLAVKECVVEAIGNMRDENAVKALIALLTNKREYDDLRCAATTALGKLGDARATRPLEIALRDLNPDVRLAAAKTLHKLGPPVSSTTQAWCAVGARQWKTAVSFGSEAVPALIVALKGYDSHLNKAAADALAKIGDARSVEPLIAALLSHDDWDVREAAGRAIEGLYKGGKLNEQAKRKILAKRNTISRVHHDEYWACSGHEDQAVEVSL